MTLNLKILLLILLVVVIALILTKLRSVTVSPYHANIEKKTLENENYRQVEYTVPKSMQLVLMTLKPQEDIGAEVHPETTQFIRVESGQGRAIIDDHVYDLVDGSVVIVPPGSRHNIMNTSDRDLKLYTLYSPPEHAQGLIEKFKK